MSSQFNLDIHWNDENDSNHIFPDNTMLLITEKLTFNNNVN